MMSSHTKNTHKEQSSRAVNVLLIVSLSAKSTEIGPARIGPLAFFCMWRHHGNNSVLEAKHQNF